MSTGKSAAQVVSYIGMGAVDPLIEIDLIIDPGGDNLNVNPAGDVLMVRAGVTWIGMSAAALAVCGEEVAGSVIGTEDGGIIGTEDGGELGMEA